MISLLPPYPTIKSGEGYGGTEIPGFAGDVLQHYQDTLLAGSREKIALYFPTALASDGQNNHTFGGEGSYDSVWGPSTVGSGGGAVSGIDGMGIDGMGGSGEGAVRVVIRRSVLFIGSSSRVSTYGQSVTFNNSALGGDWSNKDVSAKDWMGFRRGGGGGAGAIFLKL